MRAAIYTKTGSATEVLEVAQLPEPQPEPGEVRVRIHASAVNPSDTKSRHGNGIAIKSDWAHIVPHQDGAGVIDAVGAGVNSVSLGERVWLYMAQYGRPTGTAADWTVVPAERAVRLPANTSFPEGASLGIPAMTAHAAMFLDGSVTGKTVLVQGGAGAVGFYAIQMAKWGGARQVIATVSRDEQAERARAAGADVVVNRKTEDVIARIREVTGTDYGVDRIIDVDFGANQQTSLGVLAPNGVVAAYASDADPKPTLDFYGFMRRSATLRSVLIYQVPQSARDAAARDITHLLETKRLIHQSGARFALEDIVAAHTAMETGQIVGKIILDIAEPSAPVGMEG